MSEDATIYKVATGPVRNDMLYVPWQVRRALGMIARAKDMPADALASDVLREWLAVPRFSAKEEDLSFEPIPQAILEAMVAHPILVNRPIMVTPKGTALCRPSEKALDLLENQPESFTKEDGQKV